MKTKLLLPNYLKRVGWVILIPSTLLGLFIMIFDYKFGFLDARVFTFYSGAWMEEPHFLTLVRANLTDTIIGILFLIGAILVAFSKEKREDEFIAGVRLESLLWATYINYGVLIFCFIFFYEFEFLFVMIFNMFTILIFFIIRFYYMLYRANKSLSHEK